MQWKDVFTVVVPFLTAAVGAAVGGFFALRSLSAQVKRDLKLQCYGAFLKFHALLSSVTGEQLPAREGWHDAYLDKLKALEPVADDLIALTHLTISDELAEQVKRLRVEFRMWEAHHIVSNTSAMMPDQRTEAFQKLVTDQPKLILTTLHDVTRKYRRALRPRLFRS